MPANKITLECAKKLFSNEYAVTDILSSDGGQADVFKAVHIETSTERVIKIYRSRVSLHMLSKFKEIGDLFPEHIVKSYKFDKISNNDKEYYYEVLEYIKFGQIDDYIKKCCIQPHSKPPEVMFRNVIIETTQCISTIHKNNFIHLDIKPANILVRTEKPKFDLVLADFGIAKIFDFNENIGKTLTITSGTYPYMSPEALRGEIQGYETDYWSLGITLLELLNGKLPVEKYDTTDEVKNFIDDGSLSRKITELTSCSNEFSRFGDLLNGLLNKNPQERWGYSHIMKWLESDRIEIEYKIPCEIRDRKFNSLKKIAACSITDKKWWEAVQSYIERGLLDGWLEKNNDLAALHNKNRIIAMNPNDKEMTAVELIYTFNPDLPFKLFGLTISLSSLELYTKKICHNISAIDKAEEQIVDMLGNGKLLKYYTRYLELSKRDRGRLFAALSFAAKVSEIYPELSAKELVRKYQLLFNALLNIKKLILPSDINKKMDFIINNLEELITKDMAQKSIFASNKTFFDSLTTAEYIKMKKCITSCENKEVEKKISTEYISPASIKEEFYKGNCRNCGKISKLIKYKAEKFEKAKSSYLIPEWLNNKMYSNDKNEYFEAVNIFNDILKNNNIIKINNIAEYLENFPHLTQETILKQAGDKEMYKVLHNIIINHIDIEKINGIKNIIPKFQQGTIIQKYLDKLISAEFPWKDKDAEIIDALTKWTDGDYSQKVGFINRIYKYLRGLFRTEDKYKGMPEDFGMKFGSRIEEIAGR